MEEKNSSIVFYILITIIVTGLSILLAPKLINVCSSYIYKKQKPKLNISLL